MSRPARLARGEHKNAAEATIGLIGDHLHRGPRQGFDFDLGDDDARIFDHFMDRGAEARIRRCRPFRPSPGLPDARTSDQPTPAGPG